MTAVQSPHPGLSGILARVVVALTTAVLVPAALLWATLMLFNVPTAVTIALLWMVAAISWRWATKRSVSGLLLLTLGILTIKTALTLATGNTFIYFVQPVFADVTVAAIFLGSLWSSRPVIARLAPEFYPMDAAVRARPKVRAHLRRLTLMWGLVILAKAGITLWLLESLSTVDFVLIKGGAILTLTLTAALVTVVWSVIFGRQEGLLVSRDGGLHVPRASTILDPGSGAPTTLVVAWQHVAAADVLGADNTNRTDHHGQPIAGSTGQYP